MTELDKGRSRCDIFHATECPHCGGHMAIGVVSPRNMYLPTAIYVYADTEESRKALLEYLVDDNSGTTYRKNGKIVDDNR